MKRRKPQSTFIALATATAVILGGATVPASAGTLKKIRNSISNLRGNQQTQVQEARSAREKARKLKHKESAVHEKLEQTQRMLSVAHENFENYNQQTKKTEADIVKTRHRVQIVTARYNRHKKLFGERLAAMQENGDLSYLHMLFGSRTVSDLSRRTYLYNALTERDSDLQSKLREDKSEMQEMQNMLAQQWSERNRLRQAVARERARIWKGEQDQQKYLKEIRASRYQQAAYANAKIQSAKELEGMIQNLQARRSAIVAAYNASEARSRGPVRYEKRRVKRYVRRKKMVRSQSGQLKPMMVRDVQYSNEMVPVDSNGRSLSEHFTQDSNGNWVAPVRGHLTSRYGMRRHPILGRVKLHTGDDYAASSGTPIKAAQNGTVLYSGWKKGYGKTVIIDHGDGKTTLYGHQSKTSVKPGQSVKAGEYIGNVGSTGYSTGPHLHFEVRKDGKPVNPRKHQD